MVGWIPHPGVGVIQQSFVFSVIWANKSWNVKPVWVFCHFPSKICQLVWNSSTLLTPLISSRAPCCPGSHLFSLATVFSFSLVLDSSQVLAPDLHIPWVSKAPQVPAVQNQAHCVKLLIAPHISFPVNSIPINPEFSLCLSSGHTGFSQYTLKFLSFSHTS